MKTLNLDNIPSEVMTQIEELAQQNDQPLDQQIIMLLKHALQSQKPKLKPTNSPETDPTWQKRQQAVPQILAEIAKRRNQRQITDNNLDSTLLIREDRDNR
ncbi:MAG: hypothetical protein AB4041_06060 [Microcystaceae cyanobacterium]